MDNGASISWLIVTTLGVLALGVMLAWGTARYRASRDRLSRRGLRPTDGPDQVNTYRRRIEKAAELERGTEDPRETRPRDARTMALIFLGALLAGGVALAAMFLNNSRYDGSSPVPVSERR